MIVDLCQYLSALFAMCSVSVLFLRRSRNYSSYETPVRFSFWILFLLLAPSLSLCLSLSFSFFHFTLPFTLLNMMLVLLHFFSLNISILGFSFRCFFFLFALFLIFCLCTYDDTHSTFIFLFFCFFLVKLKQRHFIPCKNKWLDYSHKIFWSALKITPNSRLQMHSDGVSCAWYTCNSPHVRNDRWSMNTYVQMLDHNFFFFTQTIFLLEPKMCVHHFYGQQH